MNAEPPEKHKLACLEVWGGNRKVSHAVELPGLAGWVYSAPLGPPSPIPNPETSGRDEARGGGDVLFLSVCDRDTLSRIAVADVSGHGQAVSALGENLRTLMRKHISTWDQSELMRELNHAFQRGLTDVTYATVLVLGFYRQTGQVVFTNAGHLPPLWYRAAQQQWNWLEDRMAETETEVTGLPLGLIAGTNYYQAAIRMAPSDLLVLYTDALPEAKDPAGRLLAEDGLLELARALPTHSPEAFGQGLLAAVQAYRDGAPASDDETLLVLQRIAA